MSNLELKPLKSTIDFSQIEKLRVRRLAACWYEKDTVDDWSRTVPLSYHREFVSIGRGTNDSRRSVWIRASD